jgi:hypothetical protein
MDYLLSREKTSILDLSKRARSILVNYISVLSSLHFRIYSRARNSAENLLTLRLHYSVFNHKALLDGALLLIRIYCSRID